MLRLQSLTPPQRTAYDATVAASHHREVEVEFLHRRRDRKAYRSLTNRFLGGSIQGDTDRSPVEVLEAEILDTDYLLDWGHGQHRHYNVRVLDRRFVPDLNDWVEEIVFTGPLWDYSRSGPVVKITAEGSELLASGSVRKAFHRPAKSKATTVAKQLLREAGAESRDMRIPNRRATLPREVTVGVKRGKKDKAKKKDKGPKRRRLELDREDSYLEPVEEIAQALDLDFFVDGRGRFTFAPPRTRPTLQVEPRMLLAPVDEKPAQGIEETTNTWLVLGRDPKGPRERVRAEVGLPRSHPASAAKMAWNDNGVPREVVERIENDKLRTSKQALAVARRRRDRALRELVTYEAQVLPVVPWWRPGGLVSLPLGGGRRATARVPRWSLPLGPGADPMTLGVNRRRRFR